MVHRTLKAAAFASALGIVLGACTSPAPAPVIERAEPPKTAAPAPQPEPTKPPASPVPAYDYYTVKKGDTLFAIATQHGQSHRDIAAWNKLDNPGVIQPGQVLRVTPPKEEAPVAVASAVAGSSAINVRPIAAESANTRIYKREPRGGKQPYSEQALAQIRKAGANPGSATAEKAPAVGSSPAVAGTTGQPAGAGAAARSPGTEPVQVAKAAESATKVPELPAALPEPARTEAATSGWIWPAAGKLIGGFSETQNKGVDISGQLGDPVLAAAPGRVVYAGEGLRGYGRLVIIKHEQDFLSAYAHNNQLLVKEGDVVKQGQKIAEVGKTDADKPKLHFEIRKHGKPVDPLQYLPERSQ